MAKVRSIETVVAQLKKSASAKQAAAASGAPGTPAVQVTETDPQDKGTVKKPHDPQTDLNVMNLPGGKSNPDNVDKTPVLTPANPPGKTVNESAEKSAADKVKKAVAGIQSLRDSILKGAATEGKQPDKSPADAGKPAPEAPKTEPKKEEPKKEEKPASVTGEDGKIEGKPVNVDKVAENVPAVPEKDPKAEPAPKPREDAIDGVPAENKDNVDKTANDLSFGPEDYVKFAAIMSQFEDGAQIAQNLIERKLGAEIAAEVVKAASVMEKQAQELEAYYASGAAEADALWAQATPEERATITKLAHVRQIVHENCSSDLEKLAFDAGAGAATEDLDAMAASPDGAMPEPSADITPEDIIAVLDELVQSGQLDEATAQAILQELLGGAEGAEAGGEGHAEPDADNMPPEIKEAAALLKQAAVLTEKLTK